jgi:xanthine dehydrogenase YagS FAD-binding subunit
MSVHSFAFHTAQTEEDAISGALAGGRYIAGGTTLIDLMREEVERPEQLIDINRLPLREVRLAPDGLVIGALARMADVAGDPATAYAQPMIVEALLEGASPQLRNMASIGGNLLQRVRCPYFRALDAPCNKRDPGRGCAAIHGVNYGHAILGTSEHCVAVHPSDLAVALVALDATLLVRGPRGARRFPVEDLYRLPGDTPHLEHTLDRGELIIAVIIPPGPHTQRARYLKIRDRASYEFAIVSAAVALEIEHDVIRSARVAAGGVGTKPWRMRSSESALIGLRPGRGAWEQAADLAIEGARGLSGNAYKITLLRRTIIRALELTGGPA